MKNLSTILPLAVSTSAAMAAMTASAQDAMPPPNVILIMTDDQGYADLGIRSVLKDVKTPNLDRLAASGVLFTDGYVTSPQCSPSRAGLMTGRYQQRFGFDSISEGPLPLEERTIAERLRGAGYATGMSGKWHLDPNVFCAEWAKREHPDLVIRQGRIHGWDQLTDKHIHPYGPGQRGFDDYYWGEMQHYRRNFDREGKSLDPAGEAEVTEDYRLDVQSEAALAFLRRHAEKPFFLYLAHYGPHVPLIAPEKYLARFPGEMPERRRTALAMISAIDDGIGRILDFLEEKNLRDNTLIIFLSDNGAPLGAQVGPPMDDFRPVSSYEGMWDGSRNDPLRGEKGMLAEGGIRVPFLMSWPARLPQGVVVEQPVISLDVTATINAAAGLPPDPAFDGINLLPLLSAAQPAVWPERDLFWRFWRQTAVRSGDWKYLHAGDYNLLFNLKDDPEEAKNVAEENPDIVRSLRSKLEKWNHELTPPGLPDKPLGTQEIPWFGHYFGPARNSP